MTNLLEHSRQKPIGDPPRAVATEAADGANCDRNDGAENASESRCIRKSDDKFAFQPKHKRRHDLHKAGVERAT